MTAVALSDPASYGEGVLMICIFLTSSLYGLTSFQGISYFRTFSNDSIPLKATVLFVIALSTLHMCLCWSFMYRFFIVGFGDYLSLLIPPWSVKITVPVTCAVQTICHLFFVGRLWTLSSKNKPLCGTLVLMDIAHVGSIAAFTVKCFEATYITDLIRIPTNMHMMTACLVICVSSDVVITLSMCYYLYKGRTGYKRTDTLLTTLIIYSINTGIVTAIGDTMVVILSQALPENVAFFAVFEVTIELFANAMLTSLNTRTQLRSRLVNYCDTINLEPTGTPMHRLGLDLSLENDEPSQSSVDKFLDLEADRSRAPPAASPANALMKSNV
ncbi:hypothetical protein SISSUDRAFT_665168 [Sistotremastrum suecicum HHB10207 ss-3]|uniref:DUF6534 domain-containing protein n=1 Tax=Sistotremastrum suecicum HHB10207 ss-3 TaxID=1314776 RepID=A0A166E2Z3_9AGAM|nr:hypothetical protein SISSUDRAFT_665168 [Sistotremastrum suecicum HHB10207 ss-3]